MNTNDIRIDAASVATSVLWAAEAAINRCRTDAQRTLANIRHWDDVAIAADNAHTEASDDALWSASRLTAARDAVIAAPSPNDVWYATRQTARAEARWSGGTFTFDEAEYRAAVARDEAHRAQMEAIAEEREARATFDANAATLADAALANARAAQAAEEATVDAEEARDALAHAVAEARMAVDLMRAAAAVADDADQVVLFDVTGYMYGSRGMRAAAADLEMLIGGAEAVIEEMSLSID